MPIIHVIWRAPSHKLHKPKWTHFNWTKSFAEFIHILDVVHVWRPKDLNQLALQLQPVVVHPTLPHTAPLCAPKGFCAFSRKPSWLQRLRCWAFSIVCMVGFFPSIAAAAVYRWLSHLSFLLWQHKYNSQCLQVLHKRLIGTHAMLLEIMGAELCCVRVC
jgi:hypothetical protein